MKTILITGSTDGIGQLTAKKLAKENHRLILHGRNSEKLKKSIAEIQAETNNDKIAGFVADFSDLDEVRFLAEEVCSVYPEIDVLINNAGIFKSPVTTTKGGLNMCFAVNYFAPYILTNALLPLLMNAKKPRVINLSSAAQQSVSFKALTGELSIDTSQAYAQSKLALTMWSFDFAKEYEDINVIAVNPGSLLNTKMVQEAYGKHWSSADKGMNILVDLALSEEYKTETGKYFDNDKGEEKGYFAPAHPDAYDEHKIETLIALTEETIAK